MFGVAAALVGVAASLGAVAPALTGVAAALFGVAALRWVTAALLWRVSSSLVSRALRLLAARLVLGTPIAVVVVVVSGPALPLTSAVARVVSHRWYSWFCAERLV